MIHKTRSCRLHRLQALTERHEATLLEAAFRRTLIQTLEENRPMSETYGPNDIGFWPRVTSFDPEERAQQEQERDAALKAAYDPTWKRDKPEEYALVLAYLNNPERTEQYRGWSTCRVCQCSNGSQDWFKGPFRYPQGYVHYLVEHGFKPPQRVINAAMGR